MTNLVMIESLDFEASVKKRPYMYIGNSGLIGLFMGLIDNCIALCKTDKILFTLTILAENTFLIEIKSFNNIVNFIEQVSNKEITIDFLHFYPRIINIISERLQVTINSIEDSQTELVLKFNIDTNIIKNISIDYIDLGEELHKMAFLNRGLEIIVKDFRQKYIKQNYYSYPEGVLYLFNRMISKVTGKPEFKITFDGQINGKEYQIGVAYRTDWFPEPSILSFANNIHTIGGGSLVEGVLSGLVLATKKYIKTNSLLNHKAKKKKFWNGLIIICSVKSSELKYGGSFKEVLEDEEIRIEAEKVVCGIVYDFFTENREKTAKFIWRFDETAFSNFMI